MSHHESDEIKALERRARALRAAKKQSAVTRDGSGLRASGLVIEYVQSGSLRQARAPLGVRARAGMMIEDLRWVSPWEDL